jgi:hypothetical protein
MSPRWVPRLSVVIAPVGAILRIVALNASATYTLPALSTAAPAALLKRAAAPVPSVGSKLRRSLAGDRICPSAAVAFAYVEARWLRRCVDDCGDGGDGRL